MQLAIDPPARTPSNGRLLPPYNGWEKAFLRPWSAPSWRRTRAASSGCEQQQRHRESHKGANRRFHRAAAGSNGLLRAARGGERAPGVAEMVPKNAMVVPPSPPLPLALVLRTSNNTTPSRKDARKATNGQLLHAAGRIERPCARRGRGRRRRRARAAAEEVARERSRSSLRR